MLRQPLSPMRWHELLVALLVALGPGRAQDAPLPVTPGPCRGGGARLGPARSDPLPGLGVRRLGAAGQAEDRGRRWRPAWLFGLAGGRGWARLGGWPACAATDSAPTASRPGPPPHRARAQAPTRRTEPGPARSRRPRDAFRCPLPVTATAEIVRSFSSNRPRGVQVGRCSRATFRAQRGRSAIRRQGQGRSWRSYFGRAGPSRSACIAGHASGLPAVGMAAEAGPLGHVVLEGHPIGRRRPR